MINDEHCLVAHQCCIFSRSENCLFMDPPNTPPRYSPHRTVQAFLFTGISSNVTAVVVICGYHRLFDFSERISYRALAYAAISYVLLLSYCPCTTAQHTSQADLY